MSELAMQIFTWGGMSILAGIGFFTPKKIPTLLVLPLAVGYIGYIVLCNLSLNLNSVGFYQASQCCKASPTAIEFSACKPAVIARTQIMKVAIAPTVLLLELFMFRKIPTFLCTCSVILVCIGVTIATVTDPIVVNNSTGLTVGIMATCITALYQIWVGSKQKELEANSSQLLLAYTPQAALLLGVMVPVFEPMGWEKQVIGAVVQRKAVILAYCFNFPFSMTGGGNALRLHVHCACCHRHCRQRCAGNPREVRRRWRVALLHKSCLPSSRNDPPWLSQPVHVPRHRLYK